MSTASDSSHVAGRVESRTVRYPWNRSMAPNDTDSRYQTSASIAAVPMMPVTKRCVPMDTPMTMAISTNTVSRVSLSTLRKRTSARAPSRPKAVTMLSPITVIRTVMTTAMMTSDCVNDRE